jgi:hypothetical protein
MDNSDKPTLFSPGVGKRGMTQLHYDAYCGNLEGLIWCLEQGMEVNATDTYRGYTPTHWLADMAAVDGPRMEMLRELVRHGADINAQPPGHAPGPAAHQGPRRDPPAAPHPAVAGAIERLEQARHWTSHLTVAGSRAAADSTFGLAINPARQLRIWWAPPATTRGPGSTSGSRGRPAAGW